jgi:single-stranded-DNA-specific exonuclease
MHGIEVKPAATQPQMVRGMRALWRLRGEQSGAASLVAQVLGARGMGLAGDAEQYLEPSLKHLHDPSLLPGVERAAARLLAAALAGEAIVVYGDYDVDGVSASAILFHALRCVAPGCAVRCFVPHRLEEGYGLNAGALGDLCDQGARVIVSVDCGITAAGPARVALDRGVDLIITDHHNLPANVEDLPVAFALVHPRLPGSSYPFGELCGAGVAFKLAWRVMTLACGSTRLPEAWRGVLLELLGLCSLGVIADVVPLVDENRAMARFGLSRIKHSSIEGLRALVDASGLAGESIKAEDVGFKIGPRLNACGRMGHAKEAVELLTTATGPRAWELAQQLSRQNEVRRATEREIFEHACEMAEAAGMTRDDCRAIVLAHPAWHPGVVGIVCSRLVERFHRPAILLRTHEGQCHGSGRSVEGLNLHGALAACGGHLLSFGGHDMAAGLRLEAGKLGDFVTEFAAYVGERVGIEDLIAKQCYDVECVIDDLTMGEVQGLEKLAPFGRANPSVRLRVLGCRVATRPELLGASGKHLSFFAQSPRGKMVRVKGWGWGEQVQAIKQGSDVELFVTPEVSTWNGRSQVEATLHDVVMRG